MSFHYSTIFVLNRQETHAECHGNSKAALMQHFVHADLKTKTSALLFCFLNLLSFNSAFFYIAVFLWTTHNLDLQTNVRGLVYQNRKVMNSMFAPTWIIHVASWSALLGHRQLFLTGYMPQPITCRGQKTWFYPSCRSV